MINKILLVVFDGFGIGSYVEVENFNSLMNAIHDHKAVSLEKDITSLFDLGIKKIVTNQHIISDCDACYGRTRQESFFCDSFAAHWEMAGKVINSGHLFNNGIPNKYVDIIKRRLGINFAGNELCYEDISLLNPEIIKKHKCTKEPILLTIPTLEPISTMSIVALESIITFEMLDDYARKIADLLKAEFGINNEIGRIVVKSLKEADGKDVESKHRSDYTLFYPPNGNLLTLLTSHGIPVYATGKIPSLFNNVGITDSRLSWNNSTIFSDTIDYFNSTQKGLIWANFNSLDRPYGHSGDIDNWIAALKLYDSFVKYFKEIITPNDLLIVTGDHGCDPTGNGKHTREWNPLLVYNPLQNPVNLGDNYHRDISQTIADFFGVPFSSGRFGFAKKLKDLY